MPTKKEVFVKVVFLKIEDINTVHEQFSGLFFMKARWREPQLDSANSRDVNKINFETLWNPQLNIHNVIGSATTKVWNDVEFGHNGEAYVVEKKRVKGNFAEKMELREFPFDVQDLSLLVTSELAETDIELVEDDDDISNVVWYSFVDESEWHIKKFVQSEPRVTEDQFVPLAYRKAGLYFRCCVIRRAGFFIWNIMIVMSIISALSFVTFAVGRDKPQNRIQLAFILVLAGVTFKFAASQAVPKISYLTNLDIYIIGSMIYLFFVAVWHGIVTRWDYNETEDMDFFAFIFFVIIYFLLHITFLTSILLKGLSKRREVHNIEKEYLERLEEVMRKAGKSTNRRNRFLRNKRVGIRV